MVVSKTQIGVDENECTALGLVFLPQVWERDTEVEDHGSLNKYYGCLYCTSLANWSYSLLNSLCRMVLGEHWPRETF